MSSVSRLVAGRAGQSDQTVDYFRGVDAVSDRFHWSIAP